ncbi:unnamed protein product [Didymodactylos carnosus]|uniref:Uncharacterized protein n=1 Tax=Didymodactylos carnosus TaxID=1234261 RepID=A0A815T404_9BILA|nr:unnamed protein product [Didymodactylos carnosus]CAF1500313.1 unnamed protein product [Didymodactylos carnosus]CAF4184758.1 unnamed protein product [Didymodactylos carnosus]CAF4362081.1 unnamed protein product [Didymodactylos carnosus]
MQEDFSYNDVDDQCLENEIIGTQWITYTCDLLRSRTCRHYFIDYYNILDSYTTDTLDTACQILENVDLSEVDQTSIMKTPHDVVTLHFEHMKQWVGQLNVKDVLNAISNFTTLKLKLFPNRPFGRDILLKITMLLNASALSDGDKQNNLLVWKHLFLDTDDGEIEGGSIEHKCTEWLTDPMDIIGGLAIAAFFMKWVNDVVTTWSMLNSIKNSNFDLLIRLLYMTNKTGIFKVQRDELLQSYLPNAVNPYCQQTSTSLSIIDGSHANGGTTLIDIIKKIYETSTISPTTISSETLASATEEDNTAVTTINDLYQLGKLNNGEFKNMSDNDDYMNQ